MLHQRSRCSDRDGRFHTGAVESHHPPTALPDRRAGPAGRSVSVTVDGIAAATRWCNAAGSADDSSAAGDMARRLATSSLA